MQKALSVLYNINFKKKKGCSFYLRNPEYSAPLCFWEKVKSSLNLCMPLTWSFQGSQASNTNKWTVTLEILVELWHNCIYILARRHSVVKAESEDSDFVRKSKFRSWAWSCFQNSQDAWRSHAFLFVMNFRRHLLWKDWSLKQEIW